MSYIRDAVIGYKSDNLKALDKEYLQMVMAQMHIHDTDGMINKKDLELVEQFLANS